MSASRELLNGPGKIGHSTYSSSGVRACAFRFQWQFSRDLVARERVLAYEQSEVFHSAAFHACLVLKSSFCHIFSSELMPGMLLLVGRC